MGFKAALSIALLVSLGASSGWAKPKQTKANSTSESITKQVERLRALPAKRPIPTRTMSKPQLRARILEILKQENSPAELDAEALGMKRFGLIPKSTNYRTLMVRVLTERVHSFYDHRVNQLYISNSTRADADTAMVHEIDRALLDQHFDLGRFVDIGRRERDALVARQALIGGDGIALLLEFKMARLKQAPPWGNDQVMAALQQSMSKEKDNSTLSRVPLVVREGLLFPYIAGLQFVAHVRKHRPWSAVDAMYRKPPLSTEHILHPRKYEVYELPHKIIATVPTTGKGVSELFSTVQGEKGIELFLRSHGVPEGKATIAAQGWGGDRMAVYASPSHRGSATKGTIGVSLTSWDSENDAREFYEALEHALPTWSQSAEPIPGSSLRFSMGDETILAQRKGSKVLLVVAPSSSADKLMTKLWTDWKVVRPPPPPLAIDWKLQ